MNNSPFLFALCQTFSGVMYPFTSKQKSSIKRGNIYPHQNCRQKHQTSNETQKHLSSICLALRLSLFSESISILFPVSRNLLFKTTHYMTNIMPEMICFISVYDSIEKTTLFSCGKYTELNNAISSRICYIFMFLTVFSAKSR